MELITVDKSELLTKLRTNRDAHREMFLKAQERYREVMIEELDRALEEARNGGEIRRAFALPVPEDHTADFDTVIEMLTMDKDHMVKLSQRDFLTYVKNEWGWQASFHANTESYLVQ